MAAQGFTLFETPLGHCGIAWSERGIAGVQLPERSQLETRARLLRRFPEAREAPPPTEGRGGPLARFRRREKRVSAYGRPVTTSE